MTTPIKKGPNDFIFWLECFLREKTSDFQEFQPTMSDDIYNRWWLHVQPALSNSRIIAKRDVTHKEINLYHSRIVDPVWKVCESPVFIWTHMLSVLDSHTCWLSRNFSVPIQTPVTLWQSWHWHFLPTIACHWPQGLIFYQRLLPAALNNLIEICHFWGEKYNFVCSQYEHGGVPPL